MNGTLYGTLFEAYLTMQNDATEDYNGRFKVRLLKFAGYDGPYTTFGVYDELVDVSIPAGGIVTIPVKCQAAIGDVIMVRVYESNVNDYYNENFFMDTNTFTVAPGVVKWTADGERTAVAPTSTIKVSDNDVAVEFEGMDLSGYTITPNSNPNTIYILGPDETVPASLNGKNVVKGYKANGNLTLQEGYDFFITEQQRKWWMEHHRAAFQRAKGDERHRQRTGGMEDAGRQCRQGLLAEALQECDRR